MTCHRQLALLLPIFFLPQVSVAAKCVTEHYVVTITEHCGTDEHFCDKVTYVGINKKTGKSITLSGASVVRPCSDGVTPCQHMGYEFFSGKYRYAITDTNWMFAKLWVWKDGQTIIDERCESGE